jgi:hypothetical protein
VPSRWPNARLAIALCAWLFVCLILAKNISTSSTTSTTSSTTSTSTSSEHLRRSLTSTTSSTTSAEFLQHLFHYIHHIFHYTSTSTSSKPTRFDDSSPVPSCISLVEVEHHVCPLGSLDQGLGETFSLATLSGVSAIRFPRAFRSLRWNIVPPWVF